MKDGRIAAQGTLDDIIAADPDMYSEYNKAVELASESEAELEQSGYESESVKEERLRLQQQVKTAILKKGQGQNLICFNLLKTVTDEYPPANSNMRQPTSLILMITSL